MAPRKNLTVKMTGSSGDEITTAAEVVAQAPGTQANAQAKLAQQIAIAKASAPEPEVQKHRVSVDLPSDVFAGLGMSADILSKSKSEIIGELVADLVAPILAGKTEQEIMNYLASSKRGRPKKSRSKTGRKK